VDKTRHKIGLPENIAEETIGSSTNQMTLREAATDLSTAHHELDEYRQGALALAQKLTELQRTAKAEGDHELATTACELKQSALAVTERIGD
jgi:hypothetical protein